MKRTFVKSLILILLLLATSAAAQDLYWYPSKYRPQLFVTGAVAGRYTNVKATLVEYSSPTPSRVIFLVGKYQKQYVQAFPGIGVLHIPYHTMWMQQRWLKLKYPARILEFSLFKGTIHPGLRGTQWCVQVYVEYYKWGYPAPPSAPRWLSYPRLVTIK